jgi:hypothetical protein
VISITFQFTDDAVNTERQRHWKTAKHEEFFISFESEVSITDEKGLRIKLPEAALLGFVANCNERVLC